MLPEFWRTPLSERCPQAIFLDRDGTLNQERADYVKCWQEYVWLPGALEALALLARLQAPILVVTNQSAIGRGIIDAETIDAIHDRVRREAAAAGGRIDEFLICPHAPADQCACRKPNPGLLLAAGERYGLDLARCVLIGDSVTDMQAAAAVGCPSILVRTGRQRNALDALVAARGEGAPATAVMDDVRTAARHLAAGEQLIGANCK